MATEPTTCGNDCGACYVGNVGLAPAWFIKGVHRRVRVCPDCVRPLGFLPDGTPTVGESYAEVARKAKALDKLGEYLQHTEQELCVGYDMAEVGNFGGQYHAPYCEWQMAHHADTLLALAEALPEKE